VLIQQLQDAGTDLRQLLLHLQQRTYSSTAQDPCSCYTTAVGKYSPRKLRVSIQKSGLPREAQHTCPAALLAYCPQCTVLQSPEGNTCIPCALRGPACQALRARSGQ
jgi:hypothetical protein